MIIDNPEEKWINPIVDLQTKFRDILYTDIDHTYKHVPTNTKLKSVTQFLGGMKKPFNKEYWLDKKASELKITKEALNHQWWVLNQIGTTRGSIIHKYIEDRLAKKIFPKDYGNLQHILSTLEYVEYIESIDKLKLMADDFINDHTHLIHIMSEVVIGHIDIKLAGQFDQLYYDTNIKGFILVDNKTDKKFSKHNPYQNFNYPLQHLSECEFNKYSLQLSLYKYIIETYTNMKIIDLVVVWFNKDNDTYQKINIPYLEKEIKDLIQYYNNDNK